MFVMRRKNTVEMIVTQWFWSIGRFYLVFLAQIVIFPLNRSRFSFCLWFFLFWSDFFLWNELFLLGMNAFLWNERFSSVLTFFHQTWYFSLIWLFFASNFLFDLFFMPPNSFVCWTRFILFGAFKCSKK